MDNMLTSSNAADQLSAKYLSPADEPRAEIIDVSTADHAEVNQEALLAQLKMLSSAMAQAKSALPQPRSINEAKVAARRKANKAAKASRKKNR